MPDEHSVPGKVLAGVGAGVSLLTLLAFLAARSLVGGGSDSDSGGGGVAGPTPKLVSLEQVQLSGAALAAGGRTRSGALIRAHVDPPACSFEVQAQKLSEAWERAEIRSAPADGEGKSEVYLYLPGGEYRWRGRARAPSGETSDWQVFGGMPDAKAFAIGEDLSAPASNGTVAKMDQHDWSDSRLPQGATSIRGVRLVVEGARSAARFEVEVKTGSDPFDEAHLDYALADTAGHGEMAIPLRNGKYRWRGRLRAADGSVSPWQRPFGDSPDVDFQIEGGSNAPQPMEKESNREKTPEEPEGARGGGESAGRGLNRDPFPSETLTPPNLWDLVANVKVVVGAFVALALLVGALFWMRRLPPGGSR